MLKAPLLLGAIVQRVISITCVTKKSSKRYECGAVLISECEKEKSHAPYPWLKRA